MSSQTFLIVGLGLIGGSYARGLHAAGHTVWALDRDQDALDYALQEGFIQRGAVYDKELVSGAERVIFGLYPRTMIDWLDAHGGDLHPEALVTDVSGVKRGVVEAAQDRMAPGQEFLASHPMAGREVSGVRSSDAAIFQGANFIITPTGRNTPQAMETLRALAEELGFGHISVLTPQEHDEMIGYVSQLTHAIAVSLMNANDNTHLREYTGDSFRDLTRIAKINENLWSELFLANRDILLGEIDAFAEALGGLRAALAAGDEEELRRLFIQSTHRRRIFDGE